MLILKLTDGQFENVKIKVQNAKLPNPPTADAILHWIPACAGMTEKAGMTIAFFVLQDILLKNSICQILTLNG